MEFQKVKEIEALCEELENIINIEWVRDKVTDIKTKVSEIENPRDNIDAFHCAKELSGKLELASLEGLRDEIIWTTERKEVCARRRAKEMADWLPILKQSLSQYAEFYHAKKIAEIAQKAEQFYCKQCTCRFECVSGCENIKQLKAIITA